jgi:hypothetical protein
MDRRERNLLAQTGKWKGHGLPSSELWGDDKKEKDFPSIVLATMTLPNLDSVFTFTVSFRKLTKSNPWLEYP